MLDDALQIVLIFEPSFVALLISSACSEQVSDGSARVTTREIKVSACVLFFWSMRSM